MDTLPPVKLGHNTIIQIRRIGLVRELPDGAASIPFDYHFISRGTLSRHQVNKRLARWMNNVLRRAAAHGSACSGKTMRRLARDRAWEGRHWPRFP